MDEMTITSWDLVKAQLTKKMRANSVGYQMALNVAAELFTSLVPYLKDEKEAISAFNMDAEVKEALCNRGMLQSVMDGTERGQC